MRCNCWLMRSEYPESASSSLASNCFASVRSFVVLCEEDLRNSSSLRDNTMADDDIVFPYVETACELASRRLDWRSVMLRYERMAYTHQKHLPSFSKRPLTSLTLSLVTTLSPRAMLSSRPSVSW